MIPLDSLRHDFSKLFRALTIFALPTGCISELIASLTGDVFDRSDEVEVFNFLDELKHVTRCSATETFVTARLFADIERSRFLCMKRAETNPVAPDAPQLYVGLYGVDNRNRLAESFYVCVCNRHERRLVD